MTHLDHQYACSKGDRTNKGVVANTGVHIETVVTRRRLAHAPHFVLVGVLLIFIVMSSLNRIQHTSV